MEKTAILESPASARPLLWVYIAVALTLTAADLLVGSLSLHLIQLVRPTYPQVVVLGTYTPSPLYRLFHALYPAGLWVPLVLFLGLAIFVARSKRKTSPRLLVVLFLLHYLYLLVALVCYGLSMGQLARVAMSSG